MNFSKIPSESEAEKEYKKLLRDVKTEDPETTYQKIMSREENVLTTVQRLIEHDTNTQKAKRVPDMTLWELFLSFLRTWTQIYHELVLLAVNPITLQAILDIFLAPDRQFFVGVMVVLIALFLFFLDISR